MLIAGSNISLIKKIGDTNIKDIIPPNSAHWLDIVLIQLHGEDSFGSMLMQTSIGIEAFAFLHRKCWKKKIHKHQFSHYRNNGSTRNLWRLPRNLNLRKHRNYAKYGTAVSPIKHTQPYSTVPTVHMIPFYSNATKKISKITPITYKKLKG